jgi:hypothetical protein
MAKPQIGPPADRDRLFAGPLIERRARSLFGNNLQFVCEMSTEERWARFRQAADDLDDELGPPRTGHTMREAMCEALSDVEAWIVVERVRSASRAAPRKRRGMNRGQ